MSALTRPSGSGEEDPERAADAAALTDAADYLGERVQKIAGVIAHLDAAGQTPDLLDIEITVERRTVTQAEYFFIIAGECRDMVRSVDRQLRDAGWTENTRGIFEQRFKDLADVWSTYKQLLGYLSHASWGRTPSPDQVLTGLEQPRRRYIDALQAYLTQLFTAQKCVKQATDRAATG
jgi:hypothetical protein